MAEKATNWVGMLSVCLAELEREQLGSVCPFVDYEVARGTGGGPEDMTAWLICRNRLEQRQFTDSELSRALAALRRRMLAAGFSESAVASVRVRVTSRDEVQQHGYSGLRL
jgi:hypothetical protein